MQNRFRHGGDFDVLEFRFQHRLVGWFHVVAENVFNRLIALIHGLLDERVATERANDIDARHVRLVVR